MSQIIEQGLVFNLNVNAIVLGKEDSDEQDNSKEMNFLRNLICFNVLLGNGANLLSKST